MAKSASREAQQTAAMLRRCGYPDAEVDLPHCIDGEIGSDGFYYRAVSVYAGKYKPETIPRGIARAFAKARSALNNQ